MSRKPALTNVQFLALAIFLEPGQSGSFYCRALQQYRWPGSPKQRRHGLAYFYLRDGWHYDRNGNWVKQYRYPGRLWVDSNTEEQRKAWALKNRRNGPTSSWTLTPAGVEKAREALLKLDFDMDTLVEMP